MSLVIDLASRLPTHSVRSEAQREWQQFSTPIDLAAVAVMLANIQPDDVVLEADRGGRVDLNRDLQRLSGSSAGFIELPIWGVMSGGRSRPE